MTNVKPLDELSQSDANVTVSDAADDTRHELRCLSLLRIIGLHGRGLGARGGHELRRRFHGRRLLQGARHWTEIEAPGACEHIQEYTHTRTHTHTNHTHNTHKARNALRSLAIRSARLRCAARPRRRGLGGHRRGGLTGRTLARGLAGREGAHDRYALALHLALVVLKRRDQRGLRREAREQADGSGDASFE